MQTGSNGGIEFDAFLVLLRHQILYPWNFKIKGVPPRKKRDITLASFYKEGITFLYIANGFEKI